jgi:hypothetical protein
MSESLSARIGRFVQAQPARRSGKARAAVLALRDEIQNALADGWSVRAVWQTLHAEGSVQVGYHAFRRYVAELAPQAGAPARTRAADATEAAPPPPRRASAELATTARSSSANEAPRGFKHDRRPQLDKLYGPPDPKRGQ